MANIKLTAFQYIRIALGLPSAIWQQTAFENFDLGIDFLIVCRFIGRVRYIRSVDAPCSVG